MGYKVKGIFTSCHGVGGVKNASAGNRTRIYCLEGNNANLYTTDAMATSEYAFHLIPQMQKPTKTLAGKLAKVRQPGIEPGSIAWKATMLTFTPPTLACKAVAQGVDCLRKR